MDCREVDFSPAQSQQRIDSALRVFPYDLLMRSLAFALHLFGAPRLSIARLLSMPPESVKTVVRVVMRDGFDALRDRRRSKQTTVALSSKLPRITARRQGDWIVVELSVLEKSLRIPVSSPVQARTVLLTLVNAELLSVREVADALGMHPSHCRELARKLTIQDVDEVLVDKRRGQQQDFRVGPEQKAELIQQLAARAVTGQSTSSEVLASVVNERTEGRMSARSVRLHIQKMGLSQIKESLPRLIEEQKKTSGDL